MLVKVLSIWPTNVGIRDRKKKWQRIEDWNMTRKESREFMDNWTI